MTFSEVSELIKAGFTADEIREMFTEKEPEKEPAKDLVKEPEKEPAKEPEKEPAKDPAKEPEDTKFNQLNDTMNKILKAIQGSNLQNNSFNGNNETDINTQVDKIMSSLIRPEHNKKGDN